MVAARLFVLYVAMSCGQFCNGARVAKHDLETDSAYDPVKEQMQFCQFECKKEKCGVEGDCKRYCKSLGPMCITRHPPLEEETPDTTTTTTTPKKPEEKKPEEKKPDEKKPEEKKPKEEKSCFPADALVETPVGPKAISEVRVGDLVRSVDAAGRAFFDTVYFFGHADASSTGKYTNMELQGNHASLQISQKHFLPICPRQVPCDWADHITVYARDVKVGDYVWALDGDRLDMRLVQGLSFVSLKGLYNPYTLNGKVVVNSVVASAHSNWVLDSWTPAAWTQYLPAVYQTLFLPGRWLYHVVGPVAADALDVNNPQVAPEKHGHGPEFLIACAMFSMLVMGLFSSKDLL